MIITRNVEETLELGRRLGMLAEGGQVIALHGQLGAGKTHLTRGIAMGAQVADLGLVSSPTYVLLNVYLADKNLPGSRDVYHLDAYRIQSAEDFAAVGFEELLLEEALVVVEWAQRIPELLPADRLTIEIETLDPTTRQWDLHPSGPRSLRLAEKVAGM